MKKLKKSKGITLVALIITIIILLILAGISISALTNQGLFKQVQNAKNLTEEKAAEENEILTNYLEQMNAIIGGQVTESVPDGAVVTPVNDITTWLKTAGISKQYSYTTIEQVIADSICTKSLINNENAMKYLARSTEFADAICESETAMTYLGQSAYIDDTVINSDLWVEKLKASDYRDLVSPYQVCAYSTASDADLANMLKGYYSGWLTVDDIKTKNSVGDTRSVTLFAMETGGYSNETQPQQDVELVILDFNVDNLVNPLNGHTKALFSVRPRYSLVNQGWLNATATNSGGWANTLRRKWCNEIYINSFPEYLRNNLKEVNHKFQTGSGTFDTCNDYAFICFYGNGSYDNQYEFLSLQSNRTNSVPYWTSGLMSGDNFIATLADGTEYSQCGAGGYGDWNHANVNRGIIPIVCL